MTPLPPRFKYGDKVLEIVSETVAWIHHVLSNGYVVRRTEHVDLSADMNDYSYVGFNEVTEIPQPKPEDVELFSYTDTDGYVLKVNRLSATLDQLTVINPSGDFNAVDLPEDLKKRRELAAVIHARADVGRLQATPAIEGIENPDVVLGRKLAEVYNSTSGTSGAAYIALAQAARAELKPVWQNHGEIRHAVKLDVDTVNAVARELYATFRRTHHPDELKVWDNLREETRERWRAVAGAALEAIPPAPRRQHEV